MAAGGPAGNTRATRSGTGTVRPAESVTVAARAARGASAAADNPAISVRRSSIIALVYSHHHATGFDNRVSGLANSELHLVGRFVGDRGGHDLPTDIDSYVGRGGALLDLDDLALELITGTELHWCLSIFAWREAVAEKNFLPFRRHDVVGKLLGWKV